LCVSSANGRYPQSNKPVSDPLFEGFTVAFSVDADQSQRPGIQIPSGDYGRRSLNTESAADQTDQVPTVYCHADRSTGRDAFWGYLAGDNGRSAAELPGADHL
jgi:hypothetical protein